MKRFVLITAALGAMVATGAAVAHLKAADVTADQVATMLEKAGSGRPHIPLRGAVARSEGTVEPLTA